MELNDELQSQITEYVTKSAATIASLQESDLAKTARIAELEQKLAQANNVKVAAFQKQAAALTAPASALVEAGLLPQEEQSDWVTKAANDSSFVLEFVTKLASSMSEPEQFGFGTTFNYVKQAEESSCPFEQHLFQG